MTKIKMFRTEFAISAGLSLLAISAARADMISYNLDNGNSAVSGYSSPYGVVNVDLTDPTHATITFTSDVVSGNIYLFGAASAVDVNVNATAWSIGPITGSNGGTGFSASSLSDGGSGNVDGRGSFNETINSAGGFTTSSDKVTFTLTDTSGTWASAANVLTANNNGNYVGAHIMVTSYPANADNGANVTGYAGGDTPNTPNSVPDGGSTIIFLGSALAALGWVRRK